MTCIGINAQTIEKTELTIKASVPRISMIPGRFTIDGKELFVNVHNYELQDNIESIDVINENLECVKTISIPNINKEEDGVEHATYNINTDYHCNIASIHTNHAYCEYYDYKILLTQTLFNDDDLFEYITPIFKNNMAVGFNVMSEDGTKLSTVNCDDILGDINHYICYLSIFEINDNIYMCVTYYDEDYSYKTTFYAINPKSTEIKQVNSHINMSVSPTVVRRNENINVTLNEADNDAREVLVNNVAGQTVHRTTIPAGQNSTQINSSRLSTGLNVVSVKDEKNKCENVKVMVK